ncbi:hypothetical protein FHR83_000436 [Actinoplanes campanulatus]|uniref:Ricin B lectin domain-containing protein n=1 Tax=Actinoplanes campanulatus TaxID=113559 RepID=A0A7W5FC09_9ACTN|nr:RICIN domain-containing protein [Actinoplanes campanulatus]MBB3092802.1 hypothetical protein [Actinoplanes campanulatus]GGM99119.1 hypothetical protein GCM10010109_03640 [Actinoplanes campanulatus]
MMRIRGTDDRGSLPMAMLVITIGLSLSAALLPLVVRQVKSTTGFADRTAALNGAQIGLDVVMARVRAASDSLKNGKLEDMPQCHIIGDAGVDGTGEKLHYEVTIDYFKRDGSPIGCPLAEVPFTARVTSVGTSSGSRTLKATYTFSTTNNNIDGGAIRIDSPSAKTLCMDAGSRTPVSGDKLTMQWCNGSSTQQFGYTKELYLKLINSESAAAPRGSCLHSGASHSKGNQVVLRPCPNPGSPEGLFQFSLDGNSQFHSVTAGNVTENSLCVNVKTANTSGSLVVLGDCNSSSTQTIWRSETTVGAGMAGDSTNQLVNYAQFSRCLDLTNKDPKATYMIAWFCKQDPQGRVDWNQQFVHPVPVSPAFSAEGNIVVTKDGVEFCLKSPLSTASGAYATVVNCDNVTAANPRKDKELWWKVVHDTGVYATSYRILDSDGNCLAPTDLKATPKDTHSDGTSKVKVYQCSSSELQKWNAPANISRTTPISDVVED